MGLSDASWFAATVAILLGIYIGERILDIDFLFFWQKPEKGENKKNDGTARRYHSSKVRDTP